MLFRGLLVAASGFVFIFSPGLPIRLLLQRAQAIRRNFLIWGIIVWLIALVPSLFFQSLIRQIADASQGVDGPAQEPGYVITLVGTLLAAFFLQGLIYLVLRRHSRQKPDTNLSLAGLHLGFGVGLIAQVFTGLNLVGAGFRLAFGASEGSTLQDLASAPAATLAIGLLAMILFRVALLAVSAALGVLVARAIKERRRLFWLAVLLDALFAWLILALQLRFGGESPGVMLAGSVDWQTSLLAVFYYLAAFGLAYWWVRGQMKTMERPSSRSQKKR